VTGVRRLIERVASLTGQNRDVRPVVDRLPGLTPGPDGKTLAVTLMKGDQTYLATMHADGSNYRELYGPVPGRLWEGVLTSRLSDPTWLHDGLGLAFGIQQDDLSWVLMRVTLDGKPGPLDTRGEAFTLEPGTLHFDISPDGTRVAYERLMSFSSELWALDVASLLKRAD
jgi:hypothetical protein